jgi:pimeloyl-ACP methyl ester carboxylesterase
MSFIRETRIEANGLGFYLGEAGNPEQPLVLMLHGFPECWASWRFQLPVLAESGYYAVAPDLRGYGGTDAPEGVAAYSQRELVRDVVALIEALGHSEAVLVGHDFGSALAWQVARENPEKVRGLVALSVPYGGPAPEPPTETMKRRFGDHFFYMLYFQQPEIPERELEADVGDSLRRIFHALSGDADMNQVFGPRKGGGFLDTMPRPAEQPHWMREVDLDYYVSRFREHGFTGPLNWYRALDLHWRQTRRDQHWQITPPTIFIAGRQDPVIALNRKALERMPEYLDDHRGTWLLDDCGHWTQMEQPAQVTSLLMEFIETLERDTAAASS